jgi:hypothetical protein
MFCASQVAHTPRNKVSTVPNDVHKAYHIKMAYFISKCSVMGSMFTMFLITRKPIWWSQWDPVYCIHRSRSNAYFYYGISIADKCDSDYTAEWRITVVDLHIYFHVHFLSYFALLISLDVNLLRRQIYGRTTNRTTNITWHRVRNYLSLLICFFVLWNSAFNSSDYIRSNNRETGEQQIENDMEGKPSYCFKILQLNKICTLKTMVY